MLNAIYNEHMKQWNIEESVIGNKKDCTVGKYGQIQLPSTIKLRD